MTVRKPGNLLTPTVLLGVLLLASGCQDDPTGSRAVWSERVPLEDVRDHIATLARHNAELYLAVRPEDLGGELRELIRDANSSGVAVRPWLQLPDTGLWLNERNAVAFRDFASAYADWAEQNGVPTEWVVFDLEPSFDFADQVLALVGEGQLGAALDLAVAQFNPPDYAEARAEIAAMVADLHDRGIRCMAVTLPWVIDDLRDDDTDLQDISNIPVTGIDWDRVSIMVYRTTVTGQLDRAISPGYVASYARDIVALFGDRGAVAIGTIGSAGFLTDSGYVIPVELSLDVQAAASAGIHDISIFSLDGMVEVGDPDAWLEAAWQPTLGYAFPDLIVAIIRQYIFELDHSLNNLHEE
jgi:hypothetical protein